MFVTSGVGPYSVQLVHFKVYAPDKIESFLLSWLRLATSSSARFGAASPTYLCERLRTSSIHSFVLYSKRGPCLLLKSFRKS